MKKLILFVTVIIASLFCAHDAYAQAPKEVWIGELIAYRIDTTYIMMDMTTVTNLSLDSQPGWNVFVLRDRAGLMLSAWARVKHRNNWIVLVYSSFLLFDREATYNK